jgi:hypothetical protein
MRVSHPFGRGTDRPSSRIPDADCGAKRPPSTLGEPEPQGSWVRVCWLAPTALAGRVRQTTFHFAGGFGLSYTSSVGTTLSNLACFASSSWPITS